jgi:hypothetical protein
MPHSVEAPRLRWRSLSGGVSFPKANALSRQARAVTFSLVVLKEKVIGSEGFRYRFGRITK